MGLFKNKIVKIFDVKTIIILILIIIGYLFFQFQTNKLKSIKNKYQTELNLKNALYDDIDSLFNVNGELKLSKKTLQSNIKRLEELNNDLSLNQKKLLNKIKESEKDNEVLAAANIKMKFVIDSLQNINSKGEIDSINKKIFFYKKTSDIEYNFIVNNVIPYNKNIDVTHTINKLILPNEQYIEFTYKKDDKINLYPVSFSIINTNKYMKTYDIDSYIIPEINPRDMDVNFFKKTWLWYQKQSSLAKLGIGAILGGGTVYIIRK